MRCPECRVGELVLKETAHEVGSLLGLTLNNKVVVKGPLPVCNSCGEVVVPGQLIDQLVPSLAAKMVEAAALDAEAVKFLRKVLGLTQGELADKVDVSRATVARWEAAGSIGVAGTQALALRAAVAMQLLEENPELASTLAPLFNRPVLRSPSTFVLNAAELSVACPPSG